MDDLQLGIMCDDTRVVVGSKHVIIMQITCQDALQQHSSYANVLSGSTCLGSIQLLTLPLWQTLSIVTATGKES